MDYTLVSDSLWYRFIEAVNDKIKEGYQPIGGVAIDPNGTRTQFYQAVIKVDSNKS